VNMEHTHAFLDVDLGCSCTTKLNVYLFISNGISIHVVYFVLVH